MADIFDSDKRKEIMSAVRSKNSVAEKIVFSYLRKMNIYFQKHYTKVIGKPDLAIPSKKKAIFIDGDYWHGRYPEKVTDSVFWNEKISKNIARDKLVNKTLDEIGWHSIRFWESDIKRKSTQEVILKLIENFLAN